MMASVKQREAPTSWYQRGEMSKCWPRRRMPFGPRTAQKKSFDSQSPSKTTMFFAIGVLATLSAGPVAAFTSSSTRPVLMNWAVARRVTVARCISVRDS